MRTFLIIAAAASTMLATQATAGAVQGQDTRVVSFRGVDFNNPQAVESFYARLRTSAREVCTSNAPYDASARGRDRACVEQIVNDAVSQMQRPMLSARHERDGGTAYATR